MLGRLFDTVGRRPMIAGTYVLSGVLLAVAAFLFRSHTFGPWGLTGAWCVIFFLASAGASSAYLTVSEIFLVGAGLMVAGGLVEVVLGLDAEQAPLEQVAEPVTAV